jgi:hypothetical protein
LKCVKCGVKVQNKLSELSGNRKMPCRVFYLTLHPGTESKYIMKQIKMSPYAESIVLVDRTTGVLKEGIRNLSKETKELGRTINLIKLCMEVTKRPPNSRMVKVDDQEFERVR